MTRPHRNFRFKNKTEAFSIVGFRYDEMNSLEYLQRKDADSIVRAVEFLLKDKGADVISIRRVYLPPEEINPEPQIPLAQSEIFVGSPTRHGLLGKKVD